MIESIHKYAKIGLIHFMAYPSTIKGEGPIEETIRKIAVDDYFDAIEITWIKDGETRKKAKRMLDSSHLAVAYGGQPRTLTTGQNINDLDEEKRLITVANLKEGIDEAYEMGAVGFGFLSGKYTEDKKEEAYHALVKSTKELCAYAKSKGNLKVALEVFDRLIKDCQVECNTVPLGFQAQFHNLCLFRKRITRSAGEVGCGKTGGPNGRRCQRCTLCR